MGAKKNMALSDHFAADVAAAGPRLCSAPWADALAAGERPPFGLVLCQRCKTPVSPLYVAEQGGRVVCVACSISPTTATPAGGPGG